MLILFNDTNHKISQVLDLECIRSVNLAGARN
ncbi:MAG: hypothetical protein ACI815_000420 [Psychroserpens sp.]|jgi:hypothetical protein